MFQLVRVKSCYFGLKVHTSLNSFFYEVILHRLNIVEKRYDRVVMYTIWKN